MCIRDRRVCGFHQRRKTTAEAPAGDFLHRYFVRSRQTGIDQSSSLIIGNQSNSQTGSGEPVDKLQDRRCLSRSEKSTDHYISGFFLIHAQFNSYALEDQLFNRLTPLGMQSLDRFSQQFNVAMHIKIAFFRDSLHRIEPAFDVRIRSSYARFA